MISVFKKEEHNGRKGGKEEKKGESLLIISSYGQYTVSKDPALIIIPSTEAPPKPCLTVPKLILVSSVLGIPKASIILYSVSHPLLHLFM